MTLNSFTAQQQKRRRFITLAIVLAVIFSLLLSILTRPTAAVETVEGAAGFSTLLLPAQVAISFIALLSSIVGLTGMDLKEILKARGAPAKSSEAFPFHVIRNMDQLADLLFPDPAEPVIPDRSIPFQSGAIEQLETVFKRQGRLLICGRSKTGKTRHMLELLRRWQRANPTILLAKNHVLLRPPYKLPDTLPNRNLVLFFDDIDRYCGDPESLQQIIQTIDFFASICHDPAELRVAATARQEPEFWQKLHFDPRSPLWGQFHVHPLEPLATESAQALIERLAAENQLQFEPGIAKRMAEKNDGTYLNLALALRAWLLEGKKTITAEDIESFEGDLQNTWKKRYQRLKQVLPEAAPLYAAIGLMQKLNLPLLPEMVCDLAAELSLGKGYHFFAGALHRLIHERIGLSPLWNWYRDPRRKRRWVLTFLVVSLLLLYAAFFLVFRFMSINDQEYMFESLLKTGTQLKVLSPLVLLLIPFLVQGIHKLFAWMKNRRRKSLQAALDRVLSKEIPCRDGELKPYENQIEGNGESRAFSPEMWIDAGVQSRAFRRRAAGAAARLYWEWADALRREGKFSPARTLAETARNLAPEHPTPLFVLGQIHYDEGNYEEAAGFYQRSTEHNRTTTAALAWERLGWRRYRLQDYPQAMSACGEALRLAPAYEAPLWLRGLARLRLGEAEAALRDLQAAARDKDPLPAEVRSEIEKLLQEDERSAYRDVLEGILADKADAPAKKKARRFPLPAAAALGLALMLVAVFAVVVPKTFQSFHDGDKGLKTANTLLVLFPHSPTFYYMRAFVNYDLGNYLLMDEDVERALAIREDGNYYNMRALAYQNLGRFDEATANYLHCMQIEPENLYCANNLFGIIVTPEKRAQIIAVLTEMIGKEPEIPSYYSYRARYLIADAQPGPAAADLVTCLSLDENLQVCKTRFVSLVANSRPGEPAYDALEQGIEKHPNIAQLVYLRAYACSQYLPEELCLQNPAACANSDLFLPMVQDALREECLNDINRAIALKADVAFYNTRADFYEILEQPQNVLGDLDAAIRLDPRNSVSWYRRARFYNDSDELNKALKDINRAIRLDPARWWQYYDFRAQIYQKQGLYEKANADLSESLTLCRNDINCQIDRLIARGDFHKETGDYPAALADYKSAIELHPSGSAANLRRAEVYELLGEEEKAQADRQKDEAVTLLNIAVNSASYYGEFDVALADLERAFELAPELKGSLDGGEWNRFCWFGCLSGYAQQVGEACTRAAALEPQDADIRDSLALWRALTGDTPGAIEDFQAAVEGWQERNYEGDLENAEQRLQWIEELQAGRNPFTEEALQEQRQ